MSVRTTVLVGAAVLAGISTSALAAPPQDSRAAYEEQAAYFTSQELENLLAPIALYPDAILAQVLIAATFPEQIEFAARHVRARGTRDIDDQPWDVSVKAVAHYPPVLNMLADRPDWTTALGQAYATQSGDVMEAVQELREMADAQGNLRTTSNHRVIRDGRVIIIEPANPRIIYVPTYDPYVVYYRPIVHVGVYTGHWSFGIGFPIGAWLSYDCDWHTRRVYYTGWRVNHGWRVVAYPYIRVTPVYIHPRYDVVVINHTVIHRTVNYVNLRRYNTVHRTVTYDRPRRGAPGPIPRNVTDSRRDDGWRGDDDRNGNRPGRNPRDDRRDGGTDRPRDDQRDDGRGRNDDGRMPDRGRVVTPPRLEDKRTQSADDPRRGGSVTEGKRPTPPPVRRAEAVRPTGEASRSPRPNVARAPDVERRSSPPVRNSPPPSRAKPSAPPRASGSSSRPSASRPAGGASRSSGNGSVARGKRG
jgi:hypothetical protein